MYMSDGTPIRALPGNGLELGHPTSRESTDGNRRVLRITAASREELRQAIQRIKDRKNLDLDVETIVEAADVRSSYIDEPYLLMSPTWGPVQYKSLVKSALGLALEAGADPTSAEIAVACLTGENETRCFSPYYKRDLIRSRELGMPINCVYIKGDPVRGELMAYVEIFGILRAVIRLSDSYAGHHIEHCYAFDPRDGRELDVEILLSSSNLVEAEHEEDYYGVESGSLQEAIGHVIQRATRIANMNELDRIVASTVERYFDETGKAFNELLTDEEYRSLWDQIGQAVMPFIEHLRQPMKLPDELQDGFLPDR